MHIPKGCFLKRYHYFSTTSFICTDQKNQMAKIGGIDVYIKWPVPSEVMTLCQVLTHSVPKCINNCRVRDFTRHFRVRHDPLWVCLTCQLAATCGWRSNDNLSFQTSAFMQMCQTLLSTLCTGLQYIPKARVCLGRYPPYHTGWLVKSVNWNS